MPEAEGIEEEEACDAGIKKYQVADSVHGLE
jgi:hypothetical protein